MRSMTDSSPYEFVDWCAESNGPACLAVVPPGYETLM
jgi:hypothetical protein